MGKALSTHKNGKADAHGAGITKAGGTSGAAGSTATGTPTSTKSVEGTYLYILV